MGIRPRCLEREMDSVVECDLAKVEFAGSNPVCARVPYDTA